MPRAVSYMRNTKQALAFSERRRTPFPGIRARGRGVSGRWYQARRVCEGLQGIRGEVHMSSKGLLEVITHLCRYIIHA